MFWDEMNPTFSILTKDTPWRDWSVMFLLTGLLYYVFSVMEFYKKFVNITNIALQIQIWAIEIKIKGICYDGLQAAKLPFVSQQVEQQWPLPRDELHRADVQNRGFTGAYVVESQGSLTFVLLHRTAPRKSVGNTLWCVWWSSLRALMSTFVLFIIGKPHKGIFILFGIQEWFGELAEG